MLLSTRNYKMFVPLSFFLTIFRSFLTLLFPARYNPTISIDSTKLCRHHCNDLQFFISLLFEWYCVGGKISGSLIHAMSSRLRAKQEVSIVFRIRGRGSRVEETAFFFVCIVKSLWFVLPQSTGRFSLLFISRYFNVFCVYCPSDAGTYYSIFLPLNY